ncbi:MAG: hydroxyacid dehydrogenase [Ignavibacteriales bacterium]|nr:hydroxyacid dehydrogenase [Ignavibacteriales bacterium]
MDVYFYEVFDEEAEALRRFIGNSFSFELTWKTIQETSHTVPPASLISIRTQSQIPLPWAAQLNGILSRSTGSDHLRAFHSQASVKIPCGYLDEYASRAVAEHAILLVLSLLRKLPAQIRQVSQFDRNGITGNEILGKHLLVVGVGRIGSEICRLGKSMGFDVQGVDLIERHGDIEYVSKEEGFRWADVIVSAMNLTDANRGYFNYDLLKKAKRRIVLVNVARGEQTPLRDIALALEEGWLGGCGLDVFESERELANILRSSRTERTGQAAEFVKLLSYPNVLFTPHNAFNTREAVERKSEFTVRQLNHMLKHGAFIWQL